MSKSDRPRPIALEVAEHALAARRERIGGIKMWPEDSPPIGIYLTAEQLERDLEAAYTRGFWNAAGVSVALAIIAAGAWIGCWWVVMRT